MTHSARGPLSCGTTGSRPSSILYFLSAPFTSLSVHSSFLYIDSLYRPIDFAVELDFWKQSFISLDFSTLAIQNLSVLILKKLFLGFKVWRRSCGWNSRQQWLLETSNNSDSAELGGRINFYNEFKNVMTIYRAIWKLLKRDVCPRQQLSLSALICRNRMSHYMLMRVPIEWLRLLNGRETVNARSLLNFWWTRF